MNSYEIATTNLPKRIVTNCHEIVLDCHSLTQLWSYKTQCCASVFM